MRIIIASPEAVPYVKTGGLADVAGALLKEFRRRGEQASLILPLYAGIRERFALHDTGRSFAVPLDVYRLTGRVWASEDSPNPAAYFIQCDELFNRPDLYGTSAGDYHDNALRFAFYSKAVLETCLALDIRPDIIHCNDWQTGLLPLYARELYRQKPHFGRTAIVMTIHNLGYQGIFPKEDMRYTGLGWEYFSISGLEFYDRINFMKAGIIYADLINTVSETYAREIITEEQGFGLDGLLRTRKADLYGVLNGVDHEEYDPATDPFLAARFDGGHLAGRRACKKALLREMRLSGERRPIFAVVSRLASQKGLDLVAAAVDVLLGKGVNIVILGKGEEHFHELLSGFAARYPGRVSVTIGFDERLARGIYAGADFFLMPSRYEPCGLGQLIALRYGAVPVARRTGGLADTIRDYDSGTRQGNGFLFDEYTVSALLGAVDRALAAYRSPERFLELVRGAMQADFSWSRSAGRYHLLYRKALERVGA
ncbi:MAG: glycogen synthase GlgA [Nitrospiraceae bacterium]|nr:glycogen synthase GlgA [Nitrospiraceae bacterium]